MNPLAARACRVRKAYCQALQTWQVPRRLPDSPRLEQPVPRLGTRPTAGRNYIPDYKDVMKLMLVGSWGRTALDEIGARFAGGEHAVPPEPCVLVTRWHDPASKLFWLVVETPDSGTIQEWMSRWTDIIDWEVYPVLDDQEVGAMLGNLLGS